MVAPLGPSMASYAADILLRRNRYDGRDLSDQTRIGPFWYTAGANWADATALIVGTAVASLCLATPLFTGPIARAVGDTDLSLPVGLFGLRRRLPAHDAFPPHGHSGFPSARTAGLSSESNHPNWSGSGK